MEGLILAGLYALVGVGAAVAVGKGKHPACTSCACYVSPNPATVGMPYTIFGSGFQPGELIYLQIQGPASTQYLFPPVDSTGSFTASAYSSWPGSYTASAFDNGSRKAVFLTSCAFQVI